MKVKESIVHPRGWLRGDPAPVDHILELKIALPQTNFLLLEQQLYEISDPSHERYGKHLSKQQVEELIAPPHDSIVLVDEWLTSHGINETWRSPAKDWITVRIPIYLAERLLNTVNYSIDDLTSVFRLLLLDLSHLDS